MVLTAANAYFAHHTHTTHKKNNETEKELKHLLKHVKDGKVDMDAIAELSIQELLKFL
jgi:hypothetical protein